ncbi:MAG: molybdopterin molybdotransferase MoeA [Candidatus Heimdallarchaeaceae archaeon]
MRPFKGLISLDEALRILDENTTPLSETETVSIFELLGRVSAQDVIAELNIPPFNRSAMDGYAVKASSTFLASDRNPVHLECIDKILAGDVPHKEINENECIEIATGAMLPSSADAVVPVEYTNREGNKIEIIKSFPPNANVSLEGVDIKKGEKVIEKGMVLVPGRIGVLAALNISSLEVYRKPKVAIIPTGREIAPLGGELKLGQVYDINTYTITSLIKDIGGEPIVFDIVEDKFEDLEKAILEALEKADLVLILGGSSVGERDINIDVLEKHGTILFHGIQLKPGKPNLCAKINGKLVLNLAGYPTSCLTNGYIIVSPVLKKMAHLPQRPKQKVKAKLGRKIVSNLGRHQFFTVRLEGDVAYPAFKESGAITSIALADGYIEIPYNVDLVEEGAEVEVTLF